MHGVFSFPLPAERAAGEGWLALIEGLPLGRRRSGSAHLTLYDTFDGLLWQEGLCLRGLVSEGRRELQLLTLAGQLRGKLPLPETLDFAANLPAGRLRDVVAETIGARRLLPAVTIEKRLEIRPLYQAPASGPAASAGGRRSRTSSLASKLLSTRLRPAKKIGYLTLVDRRVVPSGALGSRDLQRRLRIEPLRGYAAACHPVVEALEVRLGRPAEALEDELADALTAAGSWLDRRSLKPGLDLDPEEAAGAAALAILRPLRATLRANEQGVVAELDREFLHDYRVALRRLRSALGQLRGLFPRREVEALRSELAWLGQQTGPKRDLDVLLESLPDLLDPLPSWVREGFVPVEAQLVQAAREAQKEIVKSFASSRYQQTMEALDGFLERRAQASRQPAAARRPIREVASERLGKAARRVVERAEALGPDPEPAALHALRIACKKLRYLLEFFRSLFPRAEIDRLLEALKGLQNVLGSLNDLVNQEQALRRAAVEVGTSALAATGYVVARLDEHRAREGERFAGALRAFLRRDNQERVRRLFSPPSSDIEVSP